jgi:hypothetical protein
MILNKNICSTRLSCVIINTKTVTPFKCIFLLPSLQSMLSIFNNFWFCVYIFFWHLFSNFWMRWEIIGRKVILLCLETFWAISFLSNRSLGIILLLRKEIFTCVYLMIYRREIVCFIVIISWHFYNKNLF